MAEEMMNHWGGFTPYESWKISEMSSRRPSGTAVTGVVLGSVAAALGIGAWIFAPIFSNAKANGLRDLANAQFNANNQQIASLAALLGTERAERVQGDITLNATINDSVSGSQQSALTAQQAAELSSVNSVMQQTYSDFVTGRASLNPTPVSLYSAPQPCPCPGSCNG